MRKLIRERRGQFVLLVLFLLFPSLVCGWSCKPPEPEPIKLVPASLCFTSVQPSSELSDADLVELARRYRTISDAKTCFTTAQMTRLRQIRPKIRIIRYRNFAAVIGQPRVEFVLKHHPDWAMRDAGDNPLFPQLDSTGLMVRPNSAGWMWYLVQRVERDMADGYDGTMADCVKMCWRLEKNFTGINTDTGRPYTTEEYRRHQLELVKAVKFAIGQKSLVLNNVKRGLFYFREEPYDFLDAADGVVSEGFRGYSHWSLEHHLSEEAWLANIEMMRDVQSKGKSIVAVVKVDRAVVDRYTLQELEDWELFQYCSFLLGVGDSAYYAVSVSDPDAQGKTRLFYPPHEIDLGKPVGEFSKVGNYYRREFEKNWVVVDLTRHKGKIVRKNWIKYEEAE